MRRVFALALSATLVSGCATAGFKLPDVSSSEIHLAEQSVSSNANALPTFFRTDEEYQRLVAAISQRVLTNVGPLCQAAETPSCFFSLEYVNDATVNAVTTEDHRVRLYRGILQYLGSEDEIAAVVGHEFGHVIADHVHRKTRNAKIGAAILGVLTATAVVLANRNNPHYNPNDGQAAVRGSMRIGAAIGAISFSKEEEREADLLSAYILARGGYDLTRAGNVWRVLAVLSGGKGGGMFDSHPAGPERMVAWGKAVGEVEANPTKIPLKD